MITGVRGLCNGLGPALYGLIFYLFHVDLNDKNGKISHTMNARPVNETHHFEDPLLTRVSLILINRKTSVSLIASNHSQYILV